MLSNFSEEAIADFTSCIQADKDFYDAYFLLYSLYEAEGNVEAGEKLLDKLYNSKNDSDEFLCVKGRIKYTLGDYEKAEGLYVNAIEAGVSDAQYYLGKLYVEYGNYEDALEKFKEASKNDTKISKGLIYYSLSDVCCQLKDYASAITYIDEGIKNADSSSYETLLKNKVIIYEYMGDYESALDSATSYLDVYPNSEDMQKEVSFIETRIESNKVNKESEDSSITEDESTTEDTQTEDENVTESIGTEGESTTEGM